MASRFGGERVIGNFKNRKYRTERNKNSRNHLKRPGMSKEHLAHIRSMSCCIPSCKANAPNDPHHLKSGTGERGGALRSTDRWAVPLCRSCHELVEAAGTRNETSWFAQRCIDPIELAMSLWGARGNVVMMMRVIEAHWSSPPIE